MKYTMNIAGLDRDLPLCKVADDLYIGAFVMFGDAEITVACARELLARAPKDYDYLLTAEAKSIPLIHEMARQSGAKTYFIARKGMKVYLTDPIHVTVHSITTQHEQDLYLSGEDAARIRGKRILIVDDVISTGDSLKAMEELVVDAGGTVAGRMAVLAEGDAQNRDDIIYLNPLPLFNADGTVKECSPAYQKRPFHFTVKWALLCIVFSGTACEAPAASALCRAARAAGAPDRTAKTPDFRPPAARAA